eukprot:11128413-Lingulodinium_polyedra.AAC.1
MIRPDAEEHFAESDIVPFVDGALRSRRSRVRLAARLWRSGLLRTVSRRRGAVHPFTVIKKVLAKTPQ